MDTTQAHQFYEECFTAIYVRRQLERLADYYAPEVINHLGIPGVPEGLAGIELTTRAFLGSFSDVGVRCEDFTQEGDMFRCQVRAEATHTGEFMGVAATGRRVELLAEHRFRTHAGRIVECWSQSDPSLVVRQLTASQAA